MRDIIAATGSNDFTRVRVGIGRPPGRQPAADFVLQDFSATEREMLPILLADAADAVELIATDGLTAAQLKFHTAPDIAARRGPRPLLGPSTFAAAANPGRSVGGCRVALVAVILQGLIPALSRASTFDSALDERRRSADFSLVDGLRVPLLAGLLDRGDATGSAGAARRSPRPGRESEARPRARSPATCPTPRSSSSRPGRPCRTSASARAPRPSASASHALRRLARRGPRRPSRPPHRSSSSPACAPPCSRSPTTSPTSSRSSSPRAAAATTSRALAARPRRPRVRAGRHGHPPRRVRGARRHPRRVPADGRAPRARRLLRRRGRADPRVLGRRPASPRRRGRRRVELPPSRELLLTEAVRQRAREMQHEFPSLAADAREDRPRASRSRAWSRSRPPSSTGWSRSPTTCRTDAAIAVLSPEQRRVAGRRASPRRTASSSPRPGTPRPPAPRRRSTSTAGDFITLARPARARPATAPGGSTFSGFDSGDGADRRAPESTTAGDYVRIDADAGAELRGQRRGRHRPRRRALADGWTVVVDRPGRGPRRARRRRARRARGRRPHRRGAARRRSSPASRYLLTGGGRGRLRAAARPSSPCSARPSSTAAPPGYDSRQVKKLASRRKNVVDPLQLKAGDFVVHTHPRHRQVRRADAARGLDAAAATRSRHSREYLVLEYAPSKRGYPGDKLYVPTDQLDLLTRYVGGEAPALSKMGGSDWAAAKGKARKAVRDIAVELVKLYSARMASQGPRLRARHPVAARARRGVPVRRDARPAHRRSTRSRPTWSGRSRWTACSRATSATARPRSPSAPRSRRCKTASRSRCSCPRRCSCGSTSRPSPSASPGSRCTCAALSRFQTDEGVEGDDRRARATARSTSSSARTACSARASPSKTSVSSSSTRSSASASSTRTRSRSSRRTSTSSR